MPKVIIIGASTGIGRSLALELYSKNYQVAIASRKVEELKEISSKCGNEVLYRQMDLQDLDESVATLSEMIFALNGIDILVLNSGIAAIYPSWKEEMKIIDVNVKGFVALAHTGMDHFKQQGHGHLVGISSIASLVGFRKTTAYSGSKAFISNYMQGLRNLSRKKKLNITITDIRPGFVLTPMTEQNLGMFWVATPEKAAKQIWQAIERKASVVYVTRRWRLFAFLIRIMPGKLRDFF
ncbi:MAG TPA: SDR family NAD(P)-dependent oxidoreductase [Cyclobacteriaceae bacterium]|jgi:short-subunit dehydrogenase